MLVKGEKVQVFINYDLYAQLYKAEESAYLDVG